MAIKDIFKISRKTYLYPSAWLGYDTLKMHSRAIYAAVKDLFTIPQPTHNETFEEAKIRLNLTEEDIQTTSRNYLYFILFFLTTGTAAFAFGVFLLVHKGLITGFLLALAVTALLFVQAFRFSFWRFQIKHRKLGCTFHEWWEGKLDVNQESRGQGS